MGIRLIKSKKNCYHKIFQWCKPLRFIVPLIMLSACTNTPYSGGIQAESLRIGMPSDEVIAKIGKPDQIVSILYDNKHSEANVYIEKGVYWISGNSWVGGVTTSEYNAQILIFTDGILKNIEVDQSRGLSNLLPAKHYEHFAKIFTTYDHCYQNMTIDDAGEGKFILKESMKSWNHFSYLRQHSYELAKSTYSPANGDCHKFYVTLAEMKATYKQR